MTLYSWCFYREIIRPAKTILILKWQKNNIFLLFSMILYSTLQATTGLFFGLAFGVLFTLWFGGIPLDSPHELMYSVHTQSLLLYMYSGVYLIFFCSDSFKQTLFCSAAMLLTRSVWA